MRKTSSLNEKPNQDCKQITEKQKQKQCHTFSFM